MEQSRRVYATRARGEVALMVAGGIAPNIEGGVFLELQVYLMQMMLQIIKL